ncbi:hypothetical protein D3C72_1258850 [compost metagenome]
MLNAQRTYHAGRGRIQPQYQFSQCGFAAAGRPHQRHYLTGHNVQRDLRQDFRFGASIVKTDLLQTQRRPILGPGAGGQ